jgi:hypothetical protein
MTKVARSARIMFVPAMAALGLVLGSWMMPQAGRSEMACPQMQCDSDKTTCVWGGEHTNCDHVSYGCVTRMC